MQTTHAVKGLISTWLLSLQAECNLVVYVSRAGETSRRVANEQALLAGEGSCGCGRREVPLL